MEYDVKRTDETGPVPVLRPIGDLPHPAPMVAPTVSKPVAAILATLATVLGFGAGVLPSPASWALAATAVILALLAGVTGFAVPRFTVGRPLVKASWIAPLGAVAGFLVDYAATLPEGYGKGGLMAAAIVCVGLAGVPLPAPRGGR
jgi:hypothetical protein